MSKKNLSVLLIFLAGLAFAETQPVFYANFDGTAVPVSAEKNIYDSGELEFQAGVRGQAMVVGIDPAGKKRGVRYPQPRGFNTRQGTVSFWVKPLNWSGRESGFFNIFFDISNQKNLFVIYHYYEGDFCYFAVGKQRFYTLTLYHIGHWKKGDWHHLTCVWSGSSREIYMDGHLVARERSIFPLEGDSLAPLMTVGERGSTFVWKGQGRLSLMDELRIYDQALTAQEIRKLYLKDVPGGTTDGLVTVGYGDHSFTGTGFIDEKGMLSLEQSSYKLATDGATLSASVSPVFGKAYFSLKSPAGKIFDYPLQEKKSCGVALQKIGFDPADRNWSFNIINGRNSLGIGKKLILDRNAPAVTLRSITTPDQKKIDVQMDAVPDGYFYAQHDSTKRYGVSEFQRPMHQNVRFQKSSCDLQLLSLQVKQKDKLLYQSDYSIRPPKPLAVKFAYTLLKTRELFVAFSGPAAGSAEVSAYDEDDDRRPVQTCRRKLPAGEFIDLTFPLKLKPGNYHLTVSHIDLSGKKTEIDRRPYRVPQENDPLIRPYVDEDEGKLPPGGWTNPVFSASDVQVWNRQFDMKGGLLFSSLHNGKGDLLAEPDALILNGRKLLPRSSAVTLLHKNKITAVYQKTVEYDECSAESRIRIHFDGYAEISLQVKPKKKLSVETLSYELPVRNQRAVLVRDNQTPGRNSITGRAGDHFALWLSKYPNYLVPTMWIGDYTSGINFTAEHLKNWQFPAGGKQVTMKRDAEAARVHFNFISKSGILSAPVNYEFGLTLTPTKPVNRKYLRQRTGKEWELWCSIWQYFNHLDPRYLRRDSVYDGVKHYRAMCRKYQDVFLYSAFNFTSPHTPFWFWYEENWRQVKFLRNYGSWTGVHLGYCEGCLNGEGYRNYRLNNWHDFLTMKNNPMLKNGSCNLYFDAPYEFSCLNRHHGCRQWKDCNGKEHQYVLINRQREMALDVWRMIKRLGPDAKTAYHHEWPLLAPMTSFMDCSTGGEGIEGVVVQHGGYYDSLTIPAFAAVYAPYNMGVKSVIIPQVRRGMLIFNPKAKWNLTDPKIKRATMHYMGLAALHDVDIQECTVFSRQWWNAQDELGWNSRTVFHPYYARNPAVRTFPESDRIKSSCYTNSGRMLLAVLNDTDQPQKVRVKLDLARLGVKAGLHGYDVFNSGQHWLLSENWESSVPPRGYILVLFGGRPKAEKKLSEFGSGLLKGIWHPYSGADVTFDAADGVIICRNSDFGNSGASTEVVLNQKTPKEITFSAESKAAKIVRGKKGLYRIYVDLYMQDGSHVWARYSCFRQTDHDWEKTCRSYMPDKPIKKLRFHVIFRDMKGEVAFRNMKLIQEK